MFSVMTLGLNAQSLESDPAEPTAEGQACWDMAIQVDYDITNITSGDLTFLWRVDRIDVPEQWDIQICDAVTCYAYGQEFCPADKPNVMAAGQEITYMSFKVKTNNISGIGDFDLVFYNETDENDVYLNLPIVVTGTACTSATHDVDVIDDLNIYPNPTSDFFKVSNEDVVNRLSIYNIVGKEVKNMSKSSSGFYNVSDLTNGMYLVRLFDEDGDVLKVVRMSKR